MEDHLRNRDRLAKEWQALCAYQAEPSVCSIAQSEANVKKNRNPDYVPCEHPATLPWGLAPRAEAGGWCGAQGYLGPWQAAVWACPQLPWALTMFPGLRFPR